MKVSIRDVNRIRSVTSNILKPFIFQLCSHRGEAWLQKSCALWNRLSNVANRVLFFFLFEPLVFFETFILLHPLATQPHKELDFPGGSAVKNLPANAGDTGDLGLILGGEDPLEKGMATHPSVLTWRIPWTEEPGGLLSVGSKRVGRDLATEHKLMPQGMHAVIYFDKFRHSFSELFFKAEGEQ